MKRKTENLDDYRQVYENDLMKITVEFTEKGYRQPKVPAMVAMMCNSVKGLAELFPLDEYYSLVGAQMQLIEAMLETAKGLEVSNAPKRWYPCVVRQPGKEKKN